MLPRYASITDEVTTWVICVLVLLSNAMTIITMVKTKRGIGQKARLYVIGVSLSDAFIVPTLIIELVFSRVGYLYQPVFHLEGIQQRDVFLKERVSNIFLGLMYFFGMGTSMYTLLAVAIDRLIAITKPLVYRSFVTDTKIKMVIVLIWIYFLCSGSCIFIYCGLKVDVDGMLRTFMPLDVLPQDIKDYVLMPHMYFAVLGNAVVYSLVYYHLKKVGREVKKEEKRNLDRNRRFFRMVVATIAVQLTLWAPLTLVYNLANINQEDSPQYLADYVQPFVYALTLCNNWVNPVLYCTLNQDYRRAYLRVLGRKRQVGDDSLNNTELGKSTVPE